MIVDRNDRLALHGAQQLCHPLALGERELDAVAFGWPVRWVLQRARAVVARDALVPRQMLNHDVCQAQVRATKVLSDAKQV